VKVELALAKGRKRIDKREHLKEKEGEREARAAMSRVRRSGER
jgi:SsrA-binding protein